MFSLILNVDVVTGNRFLYVSVHNKLKISKKFQSQIRINASLWTFQYIIFGNIKIHSGRQDFNFDSESSSTVSYRIAIRTYTINFQAFSFMRLFLVQFARFIKCCSFIHLNLSQVIISPKLKSSYCEILMRHSSANCPLFLSYLILKRGNK